MKVSIRRIVQKLHRKGDASARAPKKRKHHHDRPSEAAGEPHTNVDATVTRAGGPTVSGQTVYRTRPLRFRHLTVQEADDATLQNPSAVHPAFKIRVAKRKSTRQDARGLVERKYAGRGYTVPVVPVIAHKQPRVFTFIAYDEGEVVGTVGLGSDLGEGLSADDLYHAELESLRAEGYRVCEFTRLAVDRNAASKSVLAGLFHTAYLYASKIRGYTHAVIEVNPRHVAFYGKELHFQIIGPERTNKRVNAPAVLLCVSFKTIAEGLKKHAGRPPAPGTKRTLFHYGFPPEQEVGVMQRLEHLVLVASNGQETVPS